MILEGLNSIPFSGATVVTLGTFDGVHRGHQALLEKAKTTAQAQGLKTVALTFHQPPQNHFNGKPPKKLILPIAKKLEILESSGMDAVVVVEFPEVAELSPQAFAQQVLTDRLHTVEMVVGYDCQFGKNRSGTAETLIELGNTFGFGVNVVEPVVMDGVIVSSTEIRNAIQNGHVLKATRLLGYPPPLIGRVSERKARESIGRRLTLYVSDNMVSPEAGLFLVSTCLSGQAAFGMLRRRHLFTDHDAASFEVHLSNLSPGTPIESEIEIKLLQKLKNEHMPSLKKRPLAEIKSASDFVNATNAG